MVTISLEACAREIVELHEFFQDWFTGDRDDHPATFARFTAVMDSDFVIIGPDGILTTFPTLVDRLRSAYGRFPCTRIWTENHQRHQQLGNWAICTYEEWQATQEVTTARLSTVIFQADDRAPNGVRWLHVHETWLPI